MSKELGQREKIFFDDKLRRMAAKAAIPIGIFLGGLAFSQNSQAETSTPTTTTETTTTVKTETTTTVETERDPYDFDVVIYGNNISGVGVIRGVGRTSEDMANLKVAYIGTASYQQGPVSNGLCIEDLYDSANVASGFYKDFKKTVSDKYTLRGINPISSERLVYEPEAAREALDWFIKRPNVTFFVAHLVEASDKDGNNYVKIKTPDLGELTLTTKYFVDSSVEGDLARMLGASYKIGEDDKNIYNDKDNKPPVPSEENEFITAPQAMSELLTLKVYPKNVRAPLVSEMDISLYIEGSYNPEDFKEYDLKKFENSWSMKTAVLPNYQTKVKDKRELNEAITDNLDPLDSYEWVMGENEDRARIRKEVVSRAVNFVRYLQENGYPYIGISNVNPWPYVREGVRFVGKDEYTQEEIIKEDKKDVITTGYYALYDRHDPVTGPEHEGWAEVFVPLGSIMPVDHPDLIVTSAISTDYKSFNSAIRMEHVKANIGQAAGLLINQAFQEGKHPQEVSYEQLKPLLEKNKIKLD